MDEPENKYTLKRVVFHNNKSSIFFFTEVSVVIHLSEYKPPYKVFNTHWS